jgi:hypothetical protein
VIAWSNGSVPEVITDGVSGRIVNSIEAAVEAVQTCQMDRRQVRAEFERRFTAERMVRAYLMAYRRLLTGSAATRELMIELPLAPPIVPELLPTA